jgi:hypothetical protein
VAGWLDAMGDNIMGAQRDAEQDANGGTGRGRVWKRRPGVKAALASDAGPGAVISTVHSQSTGRRSISAVMDHQAAPRNTSRRTVAARVVVGV